MKAARLVKPSQELEIDNVKVPEPAGDEVLMEVRACGICGTDLHLAVEGDIPTAFTPITLGHEAAGEVVQTGQGVRSIEEGDRVAMYPAATCGYCRFCRRGRQSLCENSKVYGMQRDGALAEYVTVPARSVVPLSENVDFDIGAIVTDGVATPFHALRTRANLRPGEEVGVFGCGGLGTHAIMLARLMGASKVIAVDTEPAALKRASRVGADLTLNPEKQNVAQRIGEEVEGHGLDLAVECVGLSETVELSLRCLDKGGRTVVIGVGPPSPELPPLLSFVGNEKQVIGSFGMDRRDIKDLLTLVSQNRLDLSDSVTTHYSLENVNKALKHLSSSRGEVVRIVVTPDSSS